jgi:hypothetical protein
MDLQYKKNMKKGIVFIVHHIDTEGPLCEPIDEVFVRLQGTIGIDLKLPFTPINLIRLQNGEIEMDRDLKKEIQKIISPHLVSFKENWNEIDEMLIRITALDYRNKFKDSFGNGWTYNWHIVDHVGYTTNERRRDMGFLNVFNHYERIFKELPKYNDEIQWHFHPVSLKHEAHRCATSYENSYYELHQILCRRIIEKGWFPQVNRAGFHTIRPDSNWFLEQWIPFDASNQSIDEVNSSNIQLDAINGRFGDWKGAPSDWNIYNPDLYDWRKKGDLHRYISRTLNLKTRFRNISETEIEKAFEFASKGDNVYLGVTDHDFREMSVEIEEFNTLFLNVSRRYSDIKFCNSPATKAFQSVIGYTSKEIIDNEVDFNVVINENLIKINFTNGEPFGPQPYLAIKTVNGNYIHDNFDFGNFKKEYYYTLDNETFMVSEIDKIGIATNDKYGNCKIKIIDF